ncbi:hypothetical protein [Nocardia pneumoniae]|uniref:hypothetical protein n=1 Tax=Nocardia pneumoniae TaxID=228601 RepID=UPI0012F68ACA|nr:hypothetical protein [Nocardia pneumoniae]
MNSSFTVRQVTARIVELGLVAESTVEQGIQADLLDEKLDYFGDSESEAVLYLLDELGIRYTTDYKTFRDACGGSEVYREELECVAACTRGLLSITDIELVDDTVGNHVLRFLCNGQPHEWNIAHNDEEDIETQMVFSYGLEDLLPRDSSARWCGVDSDDINFGMQAVFGDPQALSVLAAEFGIKFYLPE